MSAGISKEPWKVPRLVVWDVNDTIVVGNIDDAVASLLPPHRRHALSVSQKSLGWSSSTYMNQVLEALKEYRIGRWAVESLIRTLPLHRLMVDAVREMYRERVIQVLISHTNVAFIYTLLTHYGILDHFSVIFANEANWRSNTCDSSLEVFPMHEEPYGSPNHPCQCNWQYTGICRRLALTNIINHLKVEARIALMHANWGLCAVNCLKSADLVLSRIGSRQSVTKLRVVDVGGGSGGGGTDQSTSGNSSAPQSQQQQQQQGVQTEASKDCQFVKYQHGEDLINILRQPGSDQLQRSGGVSHSMMQAHYSDSFLSNATHYFEDTRICSTPDRRICRSYPH